MLHILKCKACSTYGLDKECKCGSQREKPKPPKFSPEDKYGTYRRKYKEALDEVESDSAQASKAA
jgi:H/ACA ribonucleoprotein complex subunit 3